MIIACLHTAQSNIGVFETVRDALAINDVSLRHEVRADLLAAAEQAGGLTPEIAAETVAALRRLSADADAVVLTCSTLGPAAAEAHLPGPVPVMRVDSALASEAVRHAGLVVAVCAVATTLAPTSSLFEDAARETGAKVEVRLVNRAWDAFKAGHLDHYLAIIADAADQAFRDGAKTVALAQASMADAARLCAMGVPIDSPTAGLRAAVAAANGRD